MTGYPNAAFPTALDTLNQIGPGGPSEQTPNGAGETHAGIHAQLAAILAAVETVIGITGSTDPSSIMYRLGLLGGVAGLGQGARIITAGTVITSADRGKLVASQNGGGTISFDAALGAGFIVSIVHLGNTPAALTVDNGAGAITFPGVYPLSATTITLKPYEAITLMCLTGSNVWAVIGGSGLPVKPTATIDKVYGLSDSANIAVDASLGNIFDVTLAASRNMSAPTNPSDGQKVLFRITQGGTGSNIVTWNAVFDFGAAGAPTLSTAVGSVDIVGAIYNLAKLKWQMVPATLGFT